VQSLPLLPVPGDQPRQDLSLVFVGLVGQRRQHDGADDRQLMGPATAQNIPYHLQSDQRPHDAAMAHRPCLASTRLLGLADLALRAAPAKLIHA